VSPISAVSARIVQRIDKIPIASPPGGYNPHSAGYGIAKISLFGTGSTYRLDHEDLLREATAYDSRPPYLIEMAKNRLDTTAKLIGSMVETTQAMEALRESEARFHSLFEPTFRTFGGAF
jgi:hypothetical protein